MTHPSSQPSTLATTPHVHIDSEVTRRIRQHARAHMATEVCGVLIGELIDHTLHIRASIEAVNAAQAGTHVTFTQDAWEAIYKVKDDLYPDDRIVGWYHSHPGFGVFLSEQDLFIQQNFFSSPDQVAWVYDPHSDEEGCFGWVDGAIHRLPTLALLDHNGDGTQRTPKPQSSSLTDEPAQPNTTPRKPRRSLSIWLHWAGIAMTHLSVLILGFILCYLLFPQVVGILADPVTNAPILQDGHPIYVKLQHRNAAPPPTAPTKPEATKPQP